VTVPATSLLATKLLAPSSRRDRPSLPALLRDSAADLAVATVVMVWVPLVLLLDRDASISFQRLLGLGTWLLLLGLLRRETPLVRAQVAVVVVFATAVEYTFSPLLEVYVYRLDNVPAFVPPGHGLVYLCALAIGRSALAGAWARPLVALTVVGLGTYALWGVVLGPRSDVLGAFWFVCLVGFLAWGPSRLLYVGAGIVVTYLEVLGTWLGTWTWQAHDPTGIVSIGNPPSGAAGGYGWFDLAALLAAPALLSGWCRRPAGRPAKRPSCADKASSSSACRWPLLATALPALARSTPSRSVNRPPASATMTDAAARSCSARSGSAAASTAPSARSM